MKTPREITNELYYKYSDRVSAVWTWEATQIHGVTAIRLYQAKIKPGFHVIGERLTLDPFTIPRVKTDFTVIDIQPQLDYHFLVGYVKDPEILDKYLSTVNFCTCQECKERVVYSVMNRGRWYNHFEKYGQK